MNYRTALVQLPLVKEPGTTPIRTPEDAWHACEDLQDLAQETFHILALNTKNRLVLRHMVSVGIVDAALVHAREVFRPAIQAGASALILVHNHPSGDPTPSAEDISITKKMIEAGKIIDIAVVDHIIIGTESEQHAGFLSMREAGLCSFA